MTVSCPACGSESFRVEREDGYGDAGLAVYCSDCGNATAQVVARTLDQRLQRDADQAGLSGWSE